MDELIKRNKGDIEVFVDTWLLTRKRPNKLILLARDKIYCDYSGKGEADNKLLDELREQLNDGQAETFKLVTNHSLNHERGNKVREFLDIHKNVTFEIAVAHVHRGAIHGHDRLVLRTLRGKDWPHVIRLILQKDGWNGWDGAWTGLNLMQWDMVKESIQRPQNCNWEEDLERNAKLEDWEDDWISRLKRIESCGPNDWVTEVVEFGDGTSRNRAMQLLYNYGRGGLKHVLESIDPDQDDGKGYAFLLYVLKTLRPDGVWRKLKPRGDSAAESEIRVSVEEVLRWRIVADYVAQKELKYQQDRQAQEGNQAEAAAKAN
ncbi:uncharacterized protein LOC110990899 [Acanthaster planci]|uniref:Uncharacterized protein LOC110990899 n=1 Tax=Acanthaster planci TaxID=133434 RepID=A0A8B8A1W2_ACAPL|nr:uncharacterized protein LOC110990899 [Acanthaster planci]XP_022111675.1 uncharacterized protein LOC110990899 [Acanthaster planci]